MRKSVVAQSPREVNIRIEVRKLYIIDELINNITEYTNININENRDKFSREKDANVTTYKEV